MCNQFDLLVCFFLTLGRNLRPPNQNRFFIVLNQKFSERLRPHCIILHCGMKILREMWTINCVQKSTNTFTKEKDLIIDDTYCK